MAFAKKRLDVVFELREGNFGDGGNSYTATGLRVAANVNVLNGPQQGYARIAVFGLPLDIMNQLSLIGRDFGKPPEADVSLFAGDDEAGMSLVFQGNIYMAMVDARAMPQVAFVIEAKPGYQGQITAADPISVNGAADVPGLLSGLADQLGMVFENNGVVAKLASPYYAGSPYWQAIQIAKDAGIDLIMDRGTMAITPRGKSREGDVPLISPDTGMVGYPQFNEHQIILQALFNPDVEYGKFIEVKSDLTPANGKWIVRMLQYQLESETPKGRWFMTMVGYPEG